MSSKCGDYLPCIVIILVILFEIMHFIFAFFFKVTDFNNVFDTLDSSPLFNFFSDVTCGSNEHIIFHVWEGIDRSKESYDSNSKIEGKTEISKINGYYFCYKKKKSYKELLYNDQIIAKNEVCKIGYKNCGTIDTLEQELCIPENEDCPLYDVGIGNENDDHKNNNHYTFDVNSNIYYNNEKYNNVNKKIIGKLILNEGQPCYNLNEKLWRKFIDIEVEDSHLKCESEILGKSSDDRYIENGKINYYKLYADNLLYYYFSYFYEKKAELSSNYVSLYKREFLGINKKCDEKSNFSQDNYKKLKSSQESEKLLLLIQPLILFVVSLSIFCVMCKRRSGEKEMFCCFFVFYFLLVFSCTICQIVFLIRIIHNDLSYDCSDKISNELLKKENTNTKLTILYTAINLGADILVIILVIVPLLFPKCEDCCDQCCYSFKSCFEDCFYSLKRCFEKCCKSSSKNINSVVINNNKGNVIKEKTKINEKMNYNGRFDEKGANIELPEKQDVEKEYNKPVNMDKFPLDKDESNNNNVNNNIMNNDIIINNNFGNNNINNNDNNIVNKNTLNKNNTIVGQNLGVPPPAFPGDDSNSKL